MTETFLFDGVPRALSPEMMAQRAADAQAVAAEQPPPAQLPVEAMGIEDLQRLLDAAKARLRQIAGA